MLALLGVRSGVVSLWAGAVFLLVLLVAGQAAGAPPGTALLRAVARGDAPRVRALLLAGAPVDTEGEGGRTPLHLAVEMHQLGVTRMLLAHGADVNTRARTGETPLMTAAKT